MSWCSEGEGIRWEVDWIVSGFDEVIGIFSRLGEVSGKFSGDFETLRCFLDNFETSCRPLPFLLLLLGFINKLIKILLNKIYKK